MQYLRQTHFFNSYVKHGEIISTLQFCRELTQEMLDDIIALEVDVNFGLSRRYFKVSTLLPCELIMVLHNQGAWDEMNMFRKTKENH